VCIFTRFGSRSCSRLIYKLSPRNQRVHAFWYGGKEQMIVLGEQQGEASIHSLFWELGIGVFEGAAPGLAVALTQAGEERCMWELAGARGLSSLTASLTVS
jgi:hypothetical protein